MQKIHESRPEPVLFLLEALDAMEAYRASHSEYAAEWYLLDIEFAAGPYREGDAHTKPKRSDKRRWRPKDCEYTYEIVTANRREFIVRAVNAQNVAEYEIASGMTAPRRIGSTDRE